MNWVLSKINAGIAAIKADGTYQKIYDKWFGGAQQKPHRARANKQAG